MLQALDVLSTPQWAAVVGFAVVSTVWSLGCGGLLLAGRRVPPIVALIPAALAVAIACGVALWSAGQLPWDTSQVGGVRRIALAQPDYLARIILFPALLPGLAVLIGTCAIAGPLRGPRRKWPAGVGFLLALLAFLALTSGAMLDLALTSTGSLLIVLGPLTLLTLVALVRGSPESSGPEASVIAAVALGHAVGAGVTMVLAMVRFNILLAHAHQGDPAAWRAPAGAIAMLACIGIAAAAATGITDTRARTTTGLAALGTLILWVPMAMVGALTQLV